MEKKCFVKILILGHIRSKQTVQIRLPLYSDQDLHCLPLHPHLWNALLHCKIKLVEFQWLEYLWNHEKMFKTGVVRANEW